MTGHLPECTLPKGWGDCICGELRSCEARVFVDRTDHWNAALDAARDAVAAVPHGISVGTGLHIHRDRALAAIDALRGES